MLPITRSFDLMQDLSRLAVHTITTKPWPIEKAIERYARAGIGGISVWQDALAGRNIPAVRRRIREAGLSVASYVRGGFFPHPDPAERRKAIEQNKTLIREAGALGAPHVVYVCGAHPALPLAQSRSYIQEAFEALVPTADGEGVQMGIEPLHPMYAGDRSAVVSLTQANDMAEAIDSDRVGVVLDVYHVWWDDRLYNEIARCAESGNLCGFHVCDWRIPTRDMLNDREIMGNGCIDVKRIRQAVDEAGFTGFIEAEIFSNEYWGRDQDVYLQEIVDAYKRFR